MHVVSGTPGRVFDMLKRKALRTRHIRLLVLDEADEMLSKGFRDQIYDVYRYLPPETQVCLGQAEVEQQSMVLVAHLPQMLARWSAALTSCDHTRRPITCGLQALAHAVAFGVQGLIKLSCALRSALLGFPQPLSPSASTLTTQSTSTTIAGGHCVSHAAP